MKKLSTLYTLVLSLMAGCISTSVNAQYCVPAYIDGCIFNDDINDFQLTGAFSTSISDMGTYCSTAGYDNRIGIIPPVTLQQGGTYSGTITSEYFSNEYVRIWIDFDSNQVFTAAEEVTNFGPFGSGDGIFPFQINVPFSAPANVTRRMRVRLVYGTTASTIDPCSSYFDGETHDYAVFIAATPPCAGAPTPGTIAPAGPIAACAGTAFNFTTTGTTFATGLTYQWEQSTNGGVTWSNAIGTGTNTLFFHTPALFTTTRYRLRVTCGTATDTTGSVNITISGPTYTTLPYTQGFESWVSFCTTTDVPSINWLNTPASGDSSWRRDDQGTSASWTYPPGGAYSPASHTGAHSARFHSWANFWNKGTLDLFVDASAAGSGKELQFYYMNQFSYSGDSLNVYISTNGGASFTPLVSFDTATSWTYKQVPFTSTSAQTILRFEGVSDYSDDIGIDDVSVVLACTGQPTAGTVNPFTPCPNQPFNLMLTGNSAAAGLTYIWQQSTNGITWTAVPGGTSQVSTATINTPTYFRAIVTCGNSSLSDTTAGVLYNVGSFYQCYCASVPQYNSDEDIGNVTIKKASGATILNNGNPTPILNNTTSTNTYTNFTNLTPVTIYKDSVYRYIVSQITNTPFFYPSLAAIWIDYNQNGVFDTWERVMLKPTTNSTGQAADTFRIPDSAQVGITGMRVILSEGTFSIPQPCGQYFYGETEDYLVNISYTPCSGTPDAGTAHISDTLVCPGTVLTLIDTTHTKHYSGLTTVWQSSTDGITYTDVPGSTGKDTLLATVPGSAVYYRLSINCSNSAATAYSNVMHVSLKNPYQCYCLSYSTGGAGVDISDIGAFAIGNFVTNTGGAHLNNASATKSYSDYTGSGIATLYADSTYPISAYHVINAPGHTDAKLTLFIDLNNNQQYDIPEERMWTGYTNSSSYYLTSSINIPATAVTGVLTGMRLIINDDTGPNVPSDEACGTYNSGETEDYVVRMRSNFATGIPKASNGIEVLLYPNPTDSRVTLQLDSKKAIDKLHLTVTNLTGQQVLVQDHHAGSTRFNTTLDLSAVARGVYLLRIDADGQSEVRKLILR